MQKAKTNQKFWSSWHCIKFLHNRAYKFISILLKLGTSNLFKIFRIIVGKYNGLKEILTFFNYFNQSPYSRPAEIEELFCDCLKSL